MATGFWEERDDFFGGVETFVGFGLSGGKDVCGGGGGRVCEAWSEGHFGNLGRTAKLINEIIKSISWQINLLPTPQPPPPPP